MGFSSSGINVYCDTYKSTFLLVSGLRKLVAKKQHTFLPLMIESEVKV